MSDTDRYIYNVPDHELEREDETDESVKEQAREALEQGTYSQDEED